MLELQNVSINFGGLQALSEVSTTIEAGEIVGLIGPNGSGKSTLFNIITGFLKPSQGVILYMGEDITSLPPHQISRRGIARTFQLVRPFLNLTVLENVVSGRYFGHQPTTSISQARQEAREMLELVGLRGEEDALARELNIVKRKQLELARALATRPKILLLDEMMTGLNRQEIQPMIDLLRSINSRGVTMIVVEHIVKAVTNLCDRIIVLNVGEKIADASPLQIIQDHAVIEAYLGKNHA